MKKYLFLILPLSLAAFFCQAQKPAAVPCDTLAPLKVLPEVGSAGNSLLVFRCDTVSTSILGNFLMANGYSERAARDIAGQIRAGIRSSAPAQYAFAIGLLDLYGGVKTYVAFYKKAVW